jgi:small subunit ribosomal protein S20
LGGFQLANIHSAEKAARRSARQHVRNRTITSGARTFIKNANALIAQGSLEAAEAATKQAVRALDKAAEKGVLKKNNAARRKSRLVLKLNALRAKK